jgi:ribosome biogenesis GTPase
MELVDLGYDGWFQQKARRSVPPECTLARVTRVDRDRYLVRNERVELPAEPTGKLLFSAATGEDLPCVGDWVFVQYHNEGTLAIIHDVLPRKTFLRRKSAGEKAEYQMIAANLDAAFIMQSCDLNFNLRRMERYLVVVNEGHVEPVIILSKCDLLDPEGLEKRIAELRLSRIEGRIIALSNKTGVGREAVREILRPGKTYCLIGSSGVGKTTLLNDLLGREMFETAAVREKDGRGRHTTARRQLSMLDNGALLIDTPGMRELGLMGVGETVDESFSEIHLLSKRCRFGDCSHLSEPGCAILEAVKSGDLPEERYQSYLKLIKESAFHEMSYVERRKKEKHFGRMVKSAMKELKKWKPSSS